MKYLLTALCVLSFLIVTLINACDVHVTHYEDGSGQITYCIPTQNCED